MESEPLLRHRLIEELRREYYRSLTSPVSDIDPEITWPDIHVWFHKLNHQNVLEEVRNIWDLVPASKLGRKTLESFSEVFVEKLLQRHASFRWLNSEVLMLGKLIESCKNSLGKLCAMHPELQSCCETPTVRSRSSTFGRQSSSTLDETPDKEDSKEVIETIPVTVTVQRTQINDLESAFAEGFLGYSIEIQLGDQSEETRVVDIEGNSVDWEYSFKYRMSLKTKFLQFTLYEHSSRPGKPPKAMVASLTSDPFAYLSMEEREESEVQWEVMNIETKDMKEAPIVWFAVRFPQMMSREVAELLLRRRNVLEARVDALRQDFRQVHQKLVQQTEAFSSIQFDGSSISVFIQQEKSCFLGCRPAAGKKEKRCLLM